MSKKILTLLLSVAVLSTTACTGVGGKSDKDSAPIIHKFPTKGQFSGVLFDGTTQIPMSVTIDGNSGTFNINNSITFTGKFNTKNIASSIDKQNDEECFSGTSSSGNKLKLALCGFGDGQYDGKSALVFGAEHANEIDAKDRTIGTYRIYFKA